MQTKTLFGIVARMNYPLYSVVIFVGKCADAKPVSSRETIKAKMYFIILCFILTRLHTDSIRFLFSLKIETRQMGEFKIYTENST